MYKNWYTVAVMLWGMSLFGSAGKPAGPMQGATATAAAPATGQSTVANAKKKPFYIRKIVFSPNGKWAIAICTTEEKGHMYPKQDVLMTLAIDKEMGKFKSITFKMYPDLDIEDVRFSQDGSLGVIIALHEGKWKAYPVVFNEETKMFMPRQPALSLEGTYVFSSANKNIIVQKKDELFLYAYNEQEKKYKLVVSQQVKDLRKMAYSPDGKYLAVLSGNTPKDAQIIIFKVDAASRTFMLISQNNFNNYVKGIEGFTYSRSGKSLTVIYIRGGVSIQVDDTTGKIIPESISEFENNHLMARLLQVDYSLHNTWLIIGGYGEEENPKGMQYILFAAQLDAHEQPIKDKNNYLRNSHILLEKPSEEVISITFSPRENMLAVVTRQQGLKVYGFDEQKGILIPMKIVSKAYREKQFQETAQAVFKEGILSEPQEHNPVHALLKEYTVDSEIIQALDSNSSDAVDKILKDKKYVSLYETDIEGNTAFMICIEKGFYATAENMADRLSLKQIVRKNNKGQDAYDLLQQRIKTDMGVTKDQLKARSALLKRLETAKEVHERKTQATEK
jgi:hypothetical protein